MDARESARALSLPFMTVPLPVKRLQCARCLRPQRTCLCALVAPVDSAVELLILQHRLEVANAKGTARLLHLCLAGSVMVTGETFEPAELERLLFDGGRMPLLLFPETADEKSLGLAAPPTVDPAALVPAALRLVVLDGTWRKSRKMLYLNPLLQSLPRLALRDLPQSGYSIRKAHAPDQASTLEASCHALALLEGAPGKLAPVLKAFAAFVRQYGANASDLHA